MWVIENPQTSKSWEFQRQHYNFYGYENLAHYSSYDENFSLKPTIFKSNIELQLLSGGGVGNKEHVLLGSYAQRSAIPPALIKDVIKQSLDYINGIERKGENIKLF